MNTLDNIKERFDKLQSANENGHLRSLEQKAFAVFNKQGIPGPRHEEWKYTRIASAFNKDYKYSLVKEADLTPELLQEAHLPGHEDANVIVFVNGKFQPALSTIMSEELVVCTLEEAVENNYKDIVLQHLGSSSKYVKDGIHALNTAFVHEGVFVHVKKGLVTPHPVYFYYITDARNSNILSQPRNLVYVSERAEVQLVENFTTIGLSESFTNKVCEIVVEQDAIVDYYQIQNDAAHTNQVSTTNFTQVGKSVIYAVTISLNGGMVRNNMNISLQAAHGEAHLYGLYFLGGKTHVDNHTVVDNTQPNCLSNELYKGIMDDSSTAVFNGKIFVEQLAQKTNAFQSNKNILLSDNASVNTKPQLEIFADDVKCSHGCTVGQLDEEGLFYLRSRGISEKMAKSLLIHAYADDIFEKIKSAPVREYVDRLISERLEYNQ